MRMRVYPGFLAFALLAAAEDPSPSEIERWVKSLNADSLEDRQHAEEKLRGIGEPARPYLEKAAQAKVAESAARARDILAVLNKDRRDRNHARLLADPEVKKALDRLRQSDPEGFSSFIDPEIWSRLPDPDVRSWMRRMGNEKRLPVAFWEHLLDCRPALWQEAMKAMLLSDLDEVHAFLLPLSKEASVRVQIMTHLAFYKEGKLVLDRVDDFLDSGTPMLEGLGLILQARRDGKDAMPRILEALKSRSEWTSHKLAEHVPAVILPASKASRKFAALYVVGEMGWKERLPELAGIVKDKEEAAGIRCAAIYAVERMGAREASGLLVEALADPDSSVRAQAAHALGRLGDAGIVPKLIEAFSECPKRDDGGVAWVILGPGDRKEAQGLLWEFDKLVGSGTSQADQEALEAEMAKRQEWQCAVREMGLLGIEEGAWTPAGLYRMRLHVQALERVTGEQAKGNWKRKARAWRAATGGKPAELSEVDIQSDPHGGLADEEWGLVQELRRGSEPRRQKVWNDVTNLTSALAAGLQAEMKKADDAPRPKVLEEKEWELIQLIRRFPEEAQTKAIRQCKYVASKTVDR